MGVGGAEAERQAPASAGGGERVPADGEFEAVHFGRSGIGVFDGAGAAQAVAHDQVVEIREETDQFRLQAFAVVADAHFVAVALFDIGAVDEEFAWGRGGNAAVVAAEETPDRVDFVDQADARGEFVDAARSAADDAAEVAGGRLVGVFEFQVLPAQAGFDREAAELHAVLDEHGVGEHVFLAVARFALAAARDVVDAS